MKDTIICDLDGTLANCEHRVHHVRNKPKNWDAFYAGVREDEVNYPVLNILDKFLCYEGLRYNIIFCSGRPERCRENTVWWLKEVAHIWCSPDSPDVQLFMRKDGDYRADYIVKEEILNEHIDKDRVLFVLDDRQQVVDMWRRNGLTCFQVAEGNF
jgi:hypothetical protein